MESLYIKQRAGFTFVELLVVVAIIVILSTILIANLGTRKTLKDIEGAQVLVSTRLRETQSAALSGKQLSAGTTPCLYRLNYGGAALTTYYFWKDASDNCSNSVVITSETLPDGVTITNSGTVDFVPPYARLAIDFNLFFSKAGSQGVLCLYSSGRIETRSNTVTCP